jgi:hypothetical protein
MLRSFFTRLASWAIQAGNAAGISFFSSQKQIIALKNRHAGERIFIIGNGPSLTMKDLGMLRNEVTIACNRIFLAFSDTPASDVLLHL